MNSRPKYNSISKAIVANHRVLSRDSPKQNEKQKPRNPSIGIAENKPRDLPLHQIARLVW
jgi:hypothetical protein